MTWRRHTLHEQIFPLVYAHYARPFPHMPAQRDSFLCAQLLDIVRRSLLWSIETKEAFVFPLVTRKNNHSEPILFWSKPPARSDKLNILTDPARDNGAAHWLSRSPRTPAHPKTVVYPTEKKEKKRKEKNISCTFFFYAEGKAAPECFFFRIFLCVGVVCLQKYKCIRMRFYLVYCWCG